MKTGAYYEILNKYEDLKEEFAQFKLRSNELHEQQEATIDTYRNYVRQLLENGHRSTIRLPFRVDV
jgi:hypothetical protein